VIELLHEPDRLFHDAPPEYVELSRAGMRECGRAVTERDFRTCHAFDVRDRLDEIAVPSLAVVGEHDALTPVEYHDYLADRIDDCERAVIEGCRTSRDARTTGRVQHGAGGVLLALSRAST